MSFITQISIPEPCSQNWHNMTPNMQGRYCMHCQKSVIDFTVMSNQQIVDYLTSRSDVCGRITNIQLQEINHQPKQQKKTFFSPAAWGLAASLLLSFPVMNVKAQHHTVKVRHAHKKPVAKPAPLRKIRGMVTDSLDNKPLPGVLIVARGTSSHTVTDASGNYSITIPASTDSLLISYTGYATEKIALNKNDGLINIAMHPTVCANIVGQAPQQISQVLGGFVGGVYIKKAPFYKRWYYRYIKRPLKSIFGS